MALIKQLKTFLSKVNIYPKTLTKAVYDEEGNRLDNVLNDTLMLTEDSEYEGAETRDADTLGGIFNAADISAIKDLVQREYAKGTTYEPGDFVVYNNFVWKCLLQTASTPVEGSYWTKTTTLDALTDKNLFNLKWGSVTTETLGGVEYQVIWQVAPTAANDVYGLLFTANGQLGYIRSNKGVKSTGITNYNANITPGWVSSNATTATKSATYSNYSEVKDSYILLNFYNGNTYKGLVKLNINSQGAKNLYINGEITSATNYDIPKGVYVTYYDGANYHIRTDGYLPIKKDISMGQNLIPSQYADGYTKENNGITYQYNSDGSITCNGTATDLSRYKIIDMAQFSSQFTFMPGDYTLSGCPAGGSNTTYALYTQGENYYDYGEGVTFPLSSDTAGIAIAIFKGATVNNLRFYPMLEYGHTRHTYQPTILSPTSAALRNLYITNDICSGWEYKTYNPGSYALADGILYRCDVANAVWPPAAPTEWKQTTVMSEVTALNNNSQYHINDTVEILVTNLMLAGRVGWSGKQIFCTIPLSKEIGSDVKTATISLQGSSANVYGCGSNFAVDISSKIESIEVMTVRANQNFLSIKLISSNSFFSFTDGVVNIMFNCRILITFK